MVGPVVGDGRPDSGRVTAADQAWDSVVAYVTAAPEGTRLPPERKFAERLGVSRSTLRSAISRLELLGYVEVRHGSGIVVRRPDVGRLLSLVFGAAPDAKVSRQALELRTALEPQLAAKAARSEDAKRLLTVALAGETRFHVALATSGGNELAGRLIEVLVSLSGDARLPDHLHEAQHAAILAAVAAGDATSSKEASLLHLRSLSRAAPT